MSWVNLGEVFYVVHRAAGAEAARDTLKGLRGRLALDLPTEARVLQAATIKARHRMAYADAFAVATARAHHAVLLTGDPEIIDGDPAWEVEDLRP
jgi:predicted nucleic acid-binding protein